MTRQQHQATEWQMTTAGSMKTRQDHKQAKEDDRKLRTVTRRACMTQLCVRKLAGQLGWRPMMSHLCFNTPYNAQYNRPIQYNYLLIQLHKTALQTMLTHARKILRHSEADDILNMSNEHEHIHSLKLAYTMSMPNRRGYKTYCLVIWPAEFIYVSFTSESRPAGCPHWGGSWWPGRSKDLQGMSLLEISHTCSSE